jgi:hypothetical protein
VKNFPHVDKLIAAWLRHISLADVAILNLKLDTLRRTSKRTGDVSSAQIAELQQRIYLVMAQRTQIEWLVRILTSRQPVAPNSCLAARRMANEFRMNGC